MEKMDYYLKKYSISDCFVVTKNLTPEEISRIGINPFLVVRRCKRCSEKIYTGPNCNSCGSMYHLICAKISKTCCGKSILPSIDLLSIKFNCNKCDQLIQYGPQCVKCKRMFHNNCLEPFDKCCKLNIFNFQKRDCGSCFKYVEIGPKCPSCGSLYHTNCIISYFECCNIPFIDYENADYNCSKCTTRVVTYGPMCFTCGKMVHKRCMDFYPQCCGQLLQRDVYFIPHLHFDSQGRYSKGRKRVHINPLHDSKSAVVVKCPENPVSVCDNGPQENGSNPSRTNDFSCIEEDLKSLLNLATVTNEIKPIITTVKQENAETHITADCSGDRSIYHATSTENMSKIFPSIFPVKTEAFAAPNNSICKLQDENHPDTIDYEFNEERSDSDMEIGPPILQAETTENNHDIILNSEPPILKTQYDIEVNQTDKGVLPVSKAIIKKPTARKPAPRQQPKRISSMKEEASKCINIVSDILVVPGVLETDQSSRTSNLKVNPAQMVSKERAKRKCTKKENNRCTRTAVQCSGNRKDRIDKNGDLQQLKSVKNATTTREKPNSRRKSRGTSSLKKRDEEPFPHIMDRQPAERFNTASPSTSSAESETVFSILNENSDDSLQNFFYYLYSIVKKFPRNVQIQTKSELFKTVIEAELKFN